MTSARSYEELLRKQGVDPSVRKTVTIEVSELELNALEDIATIDLEWALNHPQWRQLIHEIQEILLDLYHKLVREFDKSEQS